MWPGSCLLVIVMSAMAQVSNALFNESIPKKQAASCQLALSLRSKGLVLLPPIVWNDEPLPIEVAEAESEYSIILPLSGIDPRNIYVFAKPRSLLIEIRWKSSTHHPVSNAHITENVERRISRELNLPTEIEERATTVRISGDFLQVTARKSRHDQQTSWSELIRFDTRASLGCI